jgi:hypothetical protein
MIDSPAARLDDRQRRWCGACAKAHPDAYDVNTKKCEDCKVWKQDPRQNKYIFSVRRI